MVFSIISVTTDAILAAAHNHPEKIGHSRKHPYHPHGGNRKLTTLPPSDVLLLLLLLLLIN
jgi:hypothetical protein